MVRKRPPAPHLEIVAPPVTDWVPEFPGQRPPFPPGNAAAMRHGADSPRTVEPIVQELITSVLSDPSTKYLADTRYAPALLAWATAEAKTQLISNWVDGMDIQVAAASKQGQVSPLELLRKWSTTALAHRGRLGLDPLSAAKLGKDVAQGRQLDAALELTRLREVFEQGTAASSGGEGRGGGDGSA